ncbi:MAG TPA: tetratricopeptide repeat protein [Candidatus Kapabacteria bacterium]|nr:tetratricopeptide repeat protein [Candidatus Kapabacteria bacterium]
MLQAQLQIRRCKVMLATLRPYAIVISLLIIAVLAIYGQTATFGYVSYDDPGYTLQNHVVNAGLTLDGIKWALTSTTYMSNWQPLVWISYMLDVSLFGAYRPGIHHLVNLGLHLTSSIILFLVLTRMTRQLWPSAFVAALFAVHPLHVESVAWIAERKDVLSGLFWMLTMAAYVFYSERPSIGRYLLVFISMACGLATKPMLVTLPFVLLLMDYWPLRRGLQLPASAAAPSPDAPPLRLILAEKLPLLALSLISSLITYLAQRQAEAMSFGSSLTVAQRVSSAIISYAEYILKTIWPTNLAVIYPYNESWATLQVVMTASALLFVTLIVVLQARRFPYLPVGWFWFLGTLIPVIGLVQVGIQGMADRFTYIPHIGLFIAVVFLLADLGQRHVRIRQASTILGGVAVIILTAIAAVQTSYWRSSEDLFRQAVRVPGNYVAETNLAAILLDKPSRTQDELIEAFARARYAVTLKNNHADAHWILGVALANMGKTDEAILQYLEAIRYNADHGTAWAYLAAIYAQNKLMPKAAAALNEAERIAARQAQLPPRANYRPEGDPDGHLLLRER